MKKRVNSKWWKEADARKVLEALRDGYDFYGAAKAVGREKEFQITNLFQNYFDITGRDARKALRAGATVDSIMTRFREPKGRTHAGRVKKSRLRNAELVEDLVRRVIREELKDFFNPPVAARINRNQSA